ncbi:hypothetical protein FHS01_001456 [Longimicrobium terrae]|uniref:Uncharacterized protein n=1 Tax=Longimicrobium terrae TaxID=1639882 RepID=A0A841GVN3_9BACT|nr:hypothetical protein [Longimicrobium terrae]MBB6069838.1 hypothetical protein [Longimicrobium terrae]
MRGAQTGAGANHPERTNPPLRPREPPNRPLARPVRGFNRNGKTGTRRTRPRAERLPLSRLRERGLGGEGSLGMRQTVQTLLPSRVPPCAVCYHPWQQKAHELSRNI